ncbi:hypothetical protein V5P93_005141 [Actinokineospora auranticolor]|uniref:hypothetical protein n=1 Tax=Actinokineospora auranticolor TaxID=155976 RepID=UPI0011B0ED60|nr:hypothetical protein [Actinokineospora auranticolor]
MAVASDALRGRLAVQARKLDEVRAFTLTTTSRGYTKSDVEVTIDAVETERSATRVRATELTKLYFGHGDPNAPAYEAYKVRHLLSFAQVNDIWTLTSAEVALGAGPPPALYAEVPAKRPGSTKPDTSGPIANSAGITMTYDYLPCTTTPNSIGTTTTTTTALRATTAPISSRRS